VNLSTRIASVSAFFFAVATFYAPLAYGCTRPEFLPTLYILLGGGILFGLVSFVASGERPPIPGFLLVCSAVILAQGWWLTFHPIFISIVAENGGTIDAVPEIIRQDSFNCMVMITILLASFLVLCGLFVDPVLRRFLLLSSTLSGVLICAIGDVVKISGEPLMKYIWKAQDIYWNEFAFFQYHGNAGSFLILVWPLILVFTRRAYQPTGGLLRKIAWTLFSLTCAAALFLNASKAALVIGLLILPWPFATWLMRLKSKSVLLIAGCALLLVAGALVATSDLVRGSAIQRLSNVPEVSGGMQSRLDDYKMDLNGTSIVGWFGFGPGLFKVAFPYQMSIMRNAGAPVHDYAHEDYLQTVLEWGWFGTIWWALLVFGGLYRAFRTYAHRERFASKTERHLLLAAILGVIAILAHALVDFPLQIASIRYFFLILLALCWASPKLLTRPARDPNRIRYRLVIPREYARESSGESD
jgi:hypothetical protein